MSSLPPPPPGPPAWSGTPSPPAPPPASIARWRQAKAGWILLHLAIGVALWFALVFAMAFTIAIAGRTWVDRLDRDRPGPRRMDAHPARGAVAGWILFVYLRTTLWVRWRCSASRRDPHGALVAIAARPSAGCLSPDGRPSRHVDGGVTFSCRPSRGRAAGLGSRRCADRQPPSPSPWPSASPGRRRMLEAGTARGLEPDDDHDPERDRARCDRARRRPEGRRALARRHRHEGGLLPDRGGVRGRRLARDRLRRPRRRRLHRHERPGPRGSPHGRRRPRPGDGCRGRGADRRLDGGGAVARDGGAAARGRGREPLGPGHRVRRPRRRAGDARRDRGVRRPPRRTTSRTRARRARSPTPPASRP